VFDYHIYKLSIMEREMLKLSGYVWVKLRSDVIKRRDRVLSLILLTGFENSGLII